LKNLKIQTGTEPEPVQTDRFRFGFFNRKTGKPVLFFFGLFKAFLGFLMSFLMGFLMGL
jgi:hypothetical protein